MTSNASRYPLAPTTQHGWSAMFDQTEQELSSSPIQYEAPSIGTESFAKTIDHTLLKLDATSEQVDKLCEEAKRFNFKARKCLINVEHRRERCISPPMIHA